MSAQEYRHIVRIVGNDIPGERKVLTGLTHIRGIGYNFASAILTKLQINPDSNIGYLTDANVTAIEGVLNDPAKAGWFLYHMVFLTDEKIQKLEKICICFLSTQA